MEHFICVSEPEKLFFRGNFNTPNADTMMVVFERCNADKTPEITCRTEADVINFMAGKYIMTLAN